jgi:hypothetical protein
MGTAITRLVCFGSAATVLALTASACVDNNVTLFIEKVMAPDPDDNCVAQSDPDGLFYGAGALDTALSPQYEAWVLVGNQMVARGDSDTLRPESSRIQLYEAEVEIFDSSGGTISSFTHPVTGFVDVGSGTEPGWGLAKVTLVDAGTGGALGGLQTLISRIKIYGVTLGGIDVETGYYDYPIQVCSGCLPCVCPESADAEYTTACAPGQNEAVDCRLDACWAAGNFCGCPIAE